MLLRGSSSSLKSDNALVADSVASPALEFDINILETLFEARPGKNPRRE
jgi:hypothetical protein